MTSFRLTGLLETGFFPSPGGKYEKLRPGKNLLLCGMYVTSAPPEPNRPTPYPHVLPLFSPDVLENHTRPTLAHSFFYHPRDGT